MIFLLSSTLSIFYACYDERNDIRDVRFLIYDWTTPYDEWVNGTALVCFLGLSTTDTYIYTHPWPTIWRLITYLPLFSQCHTYLPIIDDTSCDQRTDQRNCFWMTPLTISRYTFVATLYCLCYILWRMIHIAALRLMFCLYHGLFNNTLMMVMQGGCTCLLRCVVLYLHIWRCLDGLLLSTQIKTMMKINITLSKTTSSHHIQQHAKNAVVQKPPNKQTSFPKYIVLRTPYGEYPRIIKDPCIIGPSHGFQLLDSYVRSRREHRYILGSEVRSTYVLPCPLQQICRTDWIMKLWIRY